MTTYRRRAPVLTSPPATPWPTLRVRPIFERHHRGCAACGDTSHTIRDCYSEGAARYWASAGNTQRAALVRRHMAELERARQRTTTAADVVARRTTHEG